MPRLSIGRRAMTVALSLMLLTAAFPLAGMVAAATASTTCSPNEGGGGTCWLDIAAPSSVRTGFAFTVQVRVTTDSTKATVATSDPCGSKAPITLSLFGEAYSNTQTVNASAGIATFSFTIPFGDAGSYDLFANGPGGGDAPTVAASTTNCVGYFFVSDSTSLMALDIPLDAPIAPCPENTNCVQATNGSATQATLIADEGSVWDDYGFQGSIVGGNCTSGGPIDTDGVLRLHLSGPTDNKVIILALNMSLVNKGIGQFNVCWNQPTLFTTLTGTTANTGDLPNCKGKDQVAPCVLSRTSGQHNVGFFSILAPAHDPNDPATYAH
jgi:hypothetical protein